MRPAPTNAFSIDVEDYFHVSAYNSVIDRGDWDALPSRVEQNTHKVLEILDQHDTVGTFFVLGWVAERHPALVRKIAGEGHEVACHGMSHKLIYVQGRENFRSETRESKALLEDIIGAQVSGYRGASFSITQSSLWALDELAELGFEYDSSIFPVRHDRYGIPGAPHQPFRIKTASGSEIVEFPMTTVNIAGWRMPVSGGGYFRIYPYALTHAALKSREKSGEPFVFYAHPWEVDPDQPLHDAGWLSNFRHRTNLRRCEARLHRLLKDFRFSTMTDVLESVSLIDVQAVDGRLQLRESA